MFYVSGIVLSLFLTLLLISKREKTIADRLLAVWLLVVTLHLIFFYFRKEGLYPQFLGGDLPLPLIHGPFLYVYTLALTRNQVSWKLYLLHFAIPLATLFYIMPFFFRPLEEKIYVFAHSGVGYETFNIVKRITIYASGIGYVILSSLALRRHRHSILEQFSYTDKINLQWLQYLIFWIAAIWVLVFTRNEDWIFGGAVSFVLFIGFFGIRQGSIFHSHPLQPTPNEEVLAEDQPEKRKYQKSGLNEGESKILHDRILKLMETEALYKQNELSLDDLAQRLDTQPNYLSQVINERERRNFYDYVNSLRIEEFKRLASKPDSRRFTLMGLAQESGFASKSSFNRYFKKATGQSPSEFMDSIGTPASK